MPSRTEAKSAPAAVPPMETMVGASGRELIYCGFGLVCFLIVLVVASGSTFLVVRDLWLDEICTYLLVTDSSVTHMLNALLHGADSNLPALYLVLRGMDAIGVPINEITLRLFSATSVIAALLGTYACLRFAFNRMSSALAVLALYCGTLLIVQTFEARFYGPWFAISAWFCYCLAAIRLRKKVLGLQVALAVLTVLMLSIHYFGVFSFISAVFFDFVADRRPLRVRLLSRWPLLAALPMIALIAFFYGPQKRALTVPTWIAPPTPEVAWNFLCQTLALLPIAVLAALAAGFHFARRRGLQVKSSSRNPLMPIAGLAALACVPLIELIFSYAVQPATITRYGLPGLGGAAVLIAWLYSRIPWKFAVGIAAALAAYAGYFCHNDAFEQEGRAAELAVYASILDKVPAQERILFESRLDLYPLALYHDELKNRLCMLDFETQEEPPGALVPTREFCIVERDANRAVARNYPAIQLFPQDKLAAGETFILVAAVEDPSPERLAKRFPGAIINRVQWRIYEMTMPR